MTVTTNRFDAELEAYRTNFAGLVELAAKAGYDRGADLVSAMAAADNAVRLAAEAGIDELDRILSASNAPRLAIRGTRRGRPVVFKIELGDDLTEAAMLGKLNESDAPAVELLASGTQETASGTMRFLVTAMTGSGVSYGRERGSVETSFDDTKKMLRLAARIQLPLGTVLDGLNGRTAYGNISGALIESTKLLKTARLAPAFDLARAARIVFHRTRSSSLTHGDFNANNAIVPTPGEFPNLPPNEFVTLDPRPALGPRELNAAEAIAQSQIIGPQCEELINYAVEVDWSLDVQHLKLAVAVFHAIYAGYSAGNQRLASQDPNVRPPTNAPEVLLQSANQLAASSGLLQGRALAS